MDTIIIHVQGFPKTTRARDLAEYFLYIDKKVPILINVPKLRYNQEAFAFITLDCPYIYKFDFFNNLVKKSENNLFIIDNICFKSFFILNSTFLIKNNQP